MMFCGGWPCGRLPLNAGYPHFHTHNLIISETYVSLGLQSRISRKALFCLRFRRLTFPGCGETFVTVFVKCRWRPPGAGAGCPGGRDGAAGASRRAWCAPAGADG